MKRLGKILCSAFCLSVLYAGFALAQTNTANQGPRIEFYLQFAFGASKTLRKFERRPRATLICSSGKCTKDLSDRVWSAIPPGDELHFAKDYLGTMEIALIPNVEEGSRAAANEAARLKEGKFQEWGSSRCRTVHLSRNDTVEKFIVIADPQEGEQANAICFAMEMMKGSGLGFWMNYDEMLSETRERQEVFLLNAGALLKFHWSTLVQPGATKQKVRDAWRSHFGL